MSAVADLAEFLIPEIKTGADIKPVSVGPVLPSALPLFDSTIGDAIRVFRTPISLRVRREEGLVFVENDALNLFGHGPTLAAAVAEFRHDLEYYWKYYRALPDEKVAGKGRELKQLYNSLFE